MSGRSLKRIILIGATGSIGKQTLDVVSRHPDLFALVGLSAHRDEQGLRKAAMAYPTATLCLSGATPREAGIRYVGAEGLIRLVEDTSADIVVNAAAGADGLEPSFAALRSGKDLALANKETIVMAGRLALAEAALHGKRILPVDSEHAAIFNMMERFGAGSVRGVIITASGGAFRQMPLERLPFVTPRDALAHPTWNMGAKITIDSASMANKGLEVIEAARLFSLAPESIDVAIHPESRVHSFIRTRDGSLYAQISRPDMRLPILNALSWPDMIDEHIADLDPTQSPMTFHKPEPLRYPLLGLAYEALMAGEGYTVAYNAADEIAVAAFMDGSIRFTDLHRVVAATLDHDHPRLVDDLDAVRDADRQARELAKVVLKEIA
ncbi:MAG TPA: 1-deoxy-D-xylulose-5-phosphate reductoisomerase [bacterium]|nr:1-deoxy-D-xylulose-5-phosphate reductoisomerase [bacterium]